MTEFVCEKRGSSDTRGLAASADALSLDPQSPGDQVPQFGRKNERRVYRVFSILKFGMPGKRASSIGHLAL